MEIETFALQNECTDAVLRWMSVSMLRTGLEREERRTWAVDVVRRALTGILGDHRDRRGMFGTSNAMV